MAFFSDVAPYIVEVGDSGQAEYCSLDDVKGVSFGEVIPGAEGFEGFGGVCFFEAVEDKYGIGGHQSPHGFNSKFFGVEPKDTIADPDDVGIYGDIHAFAFGVNTRFCG